MGLICRSEILTTVPALIKAIEAAGLVLVSDASGTTAPVARNTAAPQTLPKGITGSLMGSGVMKFTEVTEM